MKYIPLYMLLVAALMLYGAHVNPGSGWGVGAGAFTVVAGLWLGITKYRTGKFFSDSAAGH